MDRDELLNLAAEWSALSHYYRVSITDQACLWYAEDLRDLPYKAVLTAMHALRAEPKRRAFFMPADVRERLEVKSVAQSESESAEDLSARISGGISRFGYTQAARAKEHLGPIGWSVVEKLGGWVLLCQTLKASEMNTFRAQCRELCRASLDAQRKAITLGPKEAQLLHKAMPRLVAAG